MTGLSIEKLSMRFDLPDGGSVQALQDVSIDLKAGELLSVLGPSGCGKTTLLNIVAGFLAPTSGVMTLNGHTISGPDAERGMVFQQGALFEWMSVRENVGFGPSMKGMPKNNKNEIVNHLLDVVGLQDFKEKAVYELSGGMQQRVALARCLANDPDVILMDEPLGALDALTREKMQSLVLKLWKETGKTIILITHSVEEALLLGERLIVGDHQRVNRRLGIWFRPDLCALVSFLYFIDSSNPLAFSQNRPSHVGKYVPLNSVCSKIPSTPPSAWMTSVR